MKTLAIQIDESGLVRVPLEARPNASSQIKLIVLEGSEEELSGEVLARIAQQGGSFDFLASEPDLYSDSDIEPAHKNPDFGGHAPSR